MRTCVKKELIVEGEKEKNLEAFRPKSHVCAKIKDTRMLFTSEKTPA